MEHPSTVKIESINPINYCGELAFTHLKVKYEYKPPHEIPPVEIPEIDGIHDFNKCSVCQDLLKQIEEGLTEKFEGNEVRKAFPNCCSYHEVLLNIKDFNRDLFVGVPQQIAKKVIYTKQQIYNSINSENWYKEITEYIDVIVKSCGIIPGMRGLYLDDYFSNTTNCIQVLNNINEDRKKKIIDYIDSIQNPVKKDSLELQELLTIYEQWLNLFPFALKSYFGDMKQYFEKNIPMIQGGWEVDNYSGEERGKKHTLESIHQFLKDLSNSLLKKINGLALYKHGQITDVNGLTIKVINEERSFELKQGYIYDSQNNMNGIVEMIAKWFLDEQKYLGKLTPVLERIQSQQNDKKTDIIKALETIQNNFDTAEMQKIYIHFKKELVDPGYLQETELLEFLKLAFDLLEQPKIRFKFKKSPAKEIIMRAFYTYYTDVANKPFGRVKEYAALLGGYFQDYKSKTVQSNFSKTVY